MKKKSWVDERSQWGCVGSNCTSLWEKPNSHHPKKNTPARTSIKIYVQYVVDTECQNIPESILSNQTQISLLEVHLILSSTNIMALLSEYAAACLYVCTCTIYH